MNEARHSPSLHSTETKRISVQVPSSSFPHEEANMAAFSTCFKYRVSIRCLGLHSHCYAKGRGTALFSARQSN